MRQLLVPSLAVLLACGKVSRGSAEAAASKNADDLHSAAAHGHAHIDGYKHHDYHEPMPYYFSYGVKDDYYYNHFGHEETGDAKGGVKGSYYVLMPDGKKQVVKYHADHYNGYQADVYYEGVYGKGDHYGYHDHIYDHHDHKYGHHDHEHGHGHKYGHDNHKYGHGDHKHGLYDHMYGHHNHKHGHHDHKYSHHDHKYVRHDHKHGQHDHDYGHHDHKHGPHSNYGHNDYHKREDVTKQKEAKHTADAKIKGDHHGHQHKSAAADGPGFVPIYVPKAVTTKRAEKGSTNQSSAATGVKGYKGKDTQDSPNYDFVQGFNYS